MKGSWDKQLILASFKGNFTAVKEKDRAGHLVGA